MIASKQPVSHLLLDWYDAHARRLPWRAMPGEPAPDPYRVWLSEVMLQQTTVAAVTPYFAEFTRRWPRVEDLAAADEGAVMAAWAGLGYYARARNLVACARAVAALGGRFPESEAGLRTLPGLGAYTAAAIAAIAFGQRAVVVDANVERVVARLFAIDAPLPAGRKAIREAADVITPGARAGDFAQAMMDLGARVCTARAPIARHVPCTPPAAPMRRVNRRGFRSRRQRERSRSGLGGPSGSRGTARSGWCDGPARACSARCCRCLMMAGRQRPMATPCRPSMGNGKAAAWSAMSSPISRSTCR